MVGRSLARTSARGSKWEVYKPPCQGGLEGDWNDTILEASYTQKNIVSNVLIECHANVSKSITNKK